MSAYDYDPPTRSRYDDRRDRYADPRDVRDAYASRELVPRRHHDEDELTVDRAYPPGYSSRDVRRARSAEPGYYDDDYYDRGSHYSSKSHGRKRGHADSYYDSEDKARRRRVLSRQEKIIAAVAGAALAVGGKEVYDRRTAHADEEDEIRRNYLHSAAIGAAGAFAGYQGAGYYNKHSSKTDDKALVMHEGRGGRHRGGYDSDSDDDPSVKKGHKKFLESALGVTSLGAAMKALTGVGKDDDHHDRGSHRGRSSSRGSTRSRAHSINKTQKAAMAGLLAGATEAFRIAKEPGSFKGEKTKRMLTAALGAGVLGGVQHGDEHNKRDIAQSVIGGLLGNRMVHGSRKNIEEDSRTGRSRSRSRFRSRSESAGPGGGGHGGLSALASAGLAAFGAKKAVGSRDDSRGRSPSPDRHRRRSRSRSVVDSARKSLAKLGIGGDQDDGSDYGGSRTSRRHRRYEDESPDDDYRRPSRRDLDDRRHRYEDDYDDQSYRPRRRERARSDAGSDTDLGDSSDDERRARKMRGKQIITTGLATVASIHAAHGVYQSMEKRKTRKKAVKAGTMSTRQAHALKSKAILEDAASVGLAALGVKGAMSELKEAKDMSHECKLFKIEKRMRHDRRAERQRRAREGCRRRRVENWESSSAPQPVRAKSLRDEPRVETMPPSPQ